MTDPALQRAAGLAALAAAVVGLLYSVSFVVVTRLSSPAGALLSALAGALAAAVPAAGVPVAGARAAAALVAVRWWVQAECSFVPMLLLGRSGLG